MFTMKIVKKGERVQIVLKFIVASSLLVILMMIGISSFKSNPFILKKNVAINRKSQAALEFLTTYGWAFLVILIMIGTLAYFGILSPSKILPNRCNFATEFQCLDYKIKEAGVGDEFRFRLKNGVGQAITVTAVNIKNEGGTVTYNTIASCTLAPAIPPNLIWNAGVIQEFILSSAAEQCTFATTGLVAGGKGKMIVEINYYKNTAGVNYGQFASGEVYATVI